METFHLVHRSLLPLCGSVLVIVLAGQAPASAAARTLSLEERIEAQRRIERVYHGHRIGSARFFEEAVPESVLRRKVETYLKQSAALDVIWGIPVTAETLGREIARIERESRSPDRLAEIYAALDGDRFLIAECFARPSLVDHLSRGFFAFDRGIHADARAAAGAIRDRLASGALDPRVPQPARRVLTLRRASPREDAGPVSAGPGPERASASRSGARAFVLPPEDFAEWRMRFPARADEAPRLHEERDRFVVGVTLEQDDGEATLALYEVPKAAWDEWWAEARGRFDAAAVETAARAVPGGGEIARVADRSASPLASAVAAGLPPDCCESGIWDAHALRTPDLGARLGASAVWTGTEMIAWGGELPAGYERSGARYDPLIDRWLPVTTEDAPVEAPGPQRGLDREPDDRLGGDAVSIRRVAAEPSSTRAPPATLHATGG